MFQTKMKLITVKGLFAISAAFCVYYLSTTHFEFMLSLFHYMKFNLSSVSYTLLRLLQVLFPIFLLVPEKGINKAHLLKYTALAIGILYILGSSWIIYYLAANPMSMLSNFEFTKEFLQLNALNFGYLVWDSYDGYSVLFSLIEAAVYILLAFSISVRRRKTIAIYWISAILSIAMPFLYVFVISGIGKFSSMFLQKNTILFVAHIFTGAGLIVAGSDRRMWEDTVWQ